MRRNGAVAQSATTNERQVAAPSRAPGTRWLPWVLVVAGVALYLNALSAPFVFDDLPQIVEDESIRDARAPPDVRGGATRPVAKLPFAPNPAVGGLDVRGFRLANVVIHVLAALALYGIVRRTLVTTRFRDRFRAAAPWMGFAAALLWLAHPLQTASVTYVYQRCESLMGLFFLLTLYCTIRSADGTRRSLWTAAAVASAALGLGTKEVMVAAPLVVLLYDRTFLAGSFRLALRTRPILYGSLAVLWAVLAFVVVDDLFREGATAGFGTESVGALGYAMTQPEVIVHYLRLSFWPTDLCLDYGWPVVESFGDIVAPLGFLATLLAGTIWAAWRNSWLGFVGAWFFLILAPTSSFLPINDLAFEHRMYLPLAALAVVTVAAGHWLIAWAFRGSRPLALAAVGVLACALAWGTVDRNRVYESRVGLWEDAVDRSPGNPRGLFKLGVSHEAKGRLGDAIASYRQALVLRPEYVPALTNLGNAHLMRGETDRAIVYLRRVAELEPTPSHAVNLGNAYLQEGRWDMAIVRYREALSVRPDFAAAQANFGAALRMKGRLNEAILHYELALESRPNDVPTITNLGNALFQKGDVEGAIRQYELALELDPTYENARENLRRVLSAGGSGGGGR